MIQFLIKYAISIKHCRSHRNEQKEHSSSIRVSKESLKLLRALAGDDSVKNNIMKDDTPKLIDEIINIHKV